MNEFRCKFCGKLLAKEEIIIGKLEIECPRHYCRAMNRIDLTLNSVFSGEAIKI